MSVLIWKSRAGAPVASEAIVTEQITLVGRYYNKLVEIERRRRGRYVAIRVKYAPELHSVETAYESADARIAELLRETRAHRADVYRDSGGKSREVPEHIAAEVEALKAEKQRLSGEAKPLRKAFSDAMAEARETYKTRTTERAAGGGPRVKSVANADVLAEMLQEEGWPQQWKLIARSDAEAQEESRRARAACGLTPGNYLLVEAAFKRAKDDSFPLSPRFKRNDGTGRVGVQLTGTTFANLMAGGTMLRLTPDPKPGKKGKSEQHFIAWLRIGSDGRAPVWAKFPVRLHRRPPDDAAVKWAWVIVRKQGSRLRYELQLTLEHPSFSEPKRPAGVEHGGHVRLGWSTTRDACVCVARWDGGEVVVPHEMMSMPERAARLVGHADQHFDRAKRVVRLWMRMAGHRPMHWDRISKGKPRERLATACVAYAEHVYGGSTAVRAMWKAWREARASEGLDLFGSLSDVKQWTKSSGPRAVSFWLYTWARKDEHLRQWSADVRTKFECRRDAMFRQEAIRLATQYETITIDKYSIAELKRLPDLTMPGDTVSPASQRAAQWAAPGRFREILIDVMGDRCKKRERPSGTRPPGPSRKRNRLVSAPKSRITTDVVNGNL